MSGLGKIQRDFREFILGHGYEDFMQHIKSTDVPKEDSLDVYHHNIFSVHHRSLVNDYPLVFSIIDDTTARRMVRAYVELSLPCTGSLEDWGGGFIPFIQRYESASQWPYLTEMAQFEWAKHIAYCAKEEPLLKPEDMRKLVDPNQKEISFHFQPSCQLMAFLHPLEQIIQRLQNDLKEPLSDLKGTSYALILKHLGHVNVYWVSASLFVFINRLKEGQDIEVAFAAAQVLEPEFDAQEAFSFLLQHPILCRVGDDTCV